MKGDTQNGFRLKGWQVYPLRNLLVGPPGEIHIEPKVMQVLEALASNPGQVVEREILLKDIWDGRAFSDEPLTRCIAALRHALDDDPHDPEYIQTIPKRGYRLVCPVESLEQTTDDADIGFGAPSVTRKRGVLTGRRRIALPAFLGLIVIAALYVAYRSMFINTTESPQLTAEGTTQTEPSRYSIAVLPLINLSSDPEQEYFTDGMTEVLTAALGRIEALRVISRTSAMRYKATDKLLPEIARELNVDALVEGSVLRVGDEVRITLQLVHGPTDRRLWSESYERDLRDILALQGEVTRAIAEEIQIALTPQLETRLARARTVDPEAYQLWLKGNFHLNKQNEESFRKALALFQEAIDRDPEYAPAYAGLAMAYGKLGGWWASGSPDYYSRLAKETADRALALDPAVAEAHFVLANWRRFDRDWAGAERAFQQGIALDPSATFGRIDYANFLTTMGRFDESIEIGRQTLELDPLSPKRYNELGFALWYAGRDDEALELYREGLEFDPNSVQSRGLIALIDVKRGEFDQPLAFIAQFGPVQLQTLQPALVGSIGHIYGLAGQQTEARAILAILVDRRAQGYVPASSVADIYIGLGEHEEALRWLELAYEERDIRLVWLKVGWEYVRLRSDPRFQAILSRMDFPES